VGVVRAILRFEQALLDAFGIQVKLIDVPWWIGLPLVFLLATTPLVLAWFLLRSGYLFRKEFWTNSGKAVPFATFLLLLIAYGFYGRHGTRPVAHALADIGRSYLPDLIPLSILTQWALLSLFWVVFGVLVGLPVRLLLAPFGYFLLGALNTPLVFAFTVVWMAFSHARTIAHYAVLALAVVAVWGAFGYLWTLAGSSPPGRADWKRNRDRARQYPLPANAMWWQRRQRARLLVEPAPFSLLPPLGEVFRYARLAALVSTLVAVIASAPYLTGLVHPTVLPAVLHTELVVICVSLLLMVGRFRNASFELDDVPKAMVGFVDLATTLSACLLAIVGLAGSVVTLGPVPPWLVAVAPPLLVAAVIFLASLLPERRETPRWNLCLVVSCAAAPLVLPVQLALSAAFAPAITIIPFL
jgi:hypothetical protein